MFIDARSVPAGTKVQADICVIGAGAAGITLARDLARTKLSIALLESGGFDFDNETQQLYDGKIVGHPFTPLSIDRLRYFGGTTNHWSGSCCPLHSSDMEDWPFGRETLDPYYRGAQQVCQLGPFTYAPEDWTTARTRPLAFAPGSRFRTGIFQYSPPTRFGEVYRADLEKASNIRCYLNANVVDIDVGESAGEVTGLQVACLSGNRFQLVATFYVLAAGGIENPRLLLNANKVQQQGLGNGSGLVGRYFMDHAELSDAGTIAFEDSAAPGTFYVEGSDKVPKVVAQGYLYLAPEVRRAEGLPSFCIALERGAAKNNYFGKASLRNIYDSLASHHLPNHLGYDIHEVIRAAEQRVTEGFHRVFGAKPSFYSTTFGCGPVPDPQSRVTLIDEVDALGLRRVAVDWRVPNEFGRASRRAHEILGEELGRAGLGRVRLNIENAGSDPVKDATNAHHHMGTTRMHADPRHGVVDEHCRVHGIGNFFIAGSSVFPSYGFDNPTMTIVALALRLSDHLKELAT